VPPRPCRAPSGVPTLRQPPIVYWRPVASAGVFTSILVAGIVITLGIFVGHSRADRETDSPIVEPGSLKLAQVDPSPSDSIPSVGSIAGETTAVSAVADRESDLAHRATSAAADLVSSTPACESYGTAIEFLSRPDEAARQALQQHKLLFLLHVSGNFEDAKFT